MVSAAGQRDHQGGQQHKNEGEAARLSILCLQQHKEDLRDAQLGQRVRPSGS